jgi:hypothetical protein
LTPADTPKDTHTGGPFCGYGVLRAGEARFTDGHSFRRDCIEAMSVKGIMRGFGSGSWYDLTLGSSRRDRRYLSTCA